MPTPDVDDTTAGDGFEPPRDWDVPGVDYRSLIERIPAITYTQARDPASPTGRRTTYVSPQASQILGYPPEEFVRDPELWRRLRHPEDRPRILAAERAADVTRQPFHAEYRLATRDGRWLWFREDAVVAGGSAPDRALWQGVMYDITAERTAEEQARRAEIRYRSLVETLPAIVYIDQLDARASNVYTSPQSERLLGYTTQDWDDDPDLWAKILHPEDRDRCLAAQAHHVETSEPYDQTYRAIARDGRTCWIRDVAVIVYDDDGTPLFSQGFLLDITAQMEAEGALRDALDRERESAEQARRMDERRNALLHRLSHDLRGPLTAILVAASTLRHPGLTDADVSEIIAGISDGARHMETLLSEILDPELRAAPTGVTLPGARG